MFKNGIYNFNFINVKTLDNKKNQILYTLTIGYILPV